MLEELVLLGVTGLQHQGSLGGSQSHRGEGPAGAGTKGDSSLLEMHKRSREGRENTLFLPNSCSQMFHQCPALAKTGRKPKARKPGRGGSLSFKENNKSRKWTLQQTCSCSLPPRNVYAVMMHRFDMRRGKKIRNSDLGPG